MNSPGCNPGKIKEVVATPKGLNVKGLHKIQPLRGCNRLFLRHPGLHPGLFTFNPFGICILESYIMVILKPPLFKKLPRLYV